MNPRLLTEAEFRATCGPKMIPILGQEHVVQPEGVIDLEPYIAAIPAADFAGMELLPGVEPSDVRRSSDDRFDHVLYRCNRSNVYLVVVVALHPDAVYGHYVLDLGAIYSV